MSTGKKIKELRKLRRMTQAELGEASGVVESAIRNYEREVRMPSDEQLGKIADALDVPVTALEDYEIESAREALEALFKMEDTFGVKPDPDGTIAIDCKAKGAKKLTQALKAWSRALDDVESGKMTEAEYELWKASLRA